MSEQVTPIPEEESEPLHDQAAAQLSGMLAVKAEVLHGIGLDQDQADAFTGRVIAYYGQVVEPNLPVAGKGRAIMEEYRSSTYELRPTRQLHETGFPPARLRDGLPQFLEPDQADEWKEAIADGKTVGLPLADPPNRQTKQFLETLTGEPLPESIAQPPAANLVGDLLWQTANAKNTLLRLGAMDDYMAYLRAEEPLSSRQQLKRLHNERVRIVGAMRHAGIHTNDVRQQIAALE